MQVSNSEVPVVTVVALRYWKRLSLHRVNTGKVEGVGGQPFISRTVAAREAGLSEIDADVRPEQNVMPSCSVLVLIPNMGYPAPMKISVTLSIFYSKTTNGRNGKAAKLRDGAR